MQDLFIDGAERIIHAEVDIFVIEAGLHEPSQQEAVFETAITQLTGSSGNGEPHA